MFRQALNGPESPAETPASSITLEPLRRAEDGAAVRWPTRVVLARDATYLRVRFECRDDFRWATFDLRDAPLWQEEVVEVFIAPGSETPRRYFEFELNPLGALFDAAVDNPDSDRSTLKVDLGWQCPGIRWRVGHAQPDSECPQDWWAEFDLPWRSLVDSDDPLPRIWRLNFLRVERPGGLDATTGGDTEYSCWSPTLRRPADFHVPERFGYLILAEPNDPRSPRDLGIEPGNLPLIYLPRGTFDHAP